MSTSPSASRTICPIGVSSGMVAVCVVVCPHAARPFMGSRGVAATGIGPQVCHGVAAPWSPVLGHGAQVRRVVRQAECGGRPADAEVGGHEGIGVAQCPHGDVFRRPRSDARERHQGAPELGRVGPGVDHDVPVGDGPGQGHDGAAPAGRHGEGARIALGQRDERGRGGEEVGHRAERGGEELAGGEHQPSGHRPRAGDGDLLPDDGAHGELEAVGRAGDAASRIAPHHGADERVVDARPPKWRRDRHRGRAAVGSVRPRSAGRADPTGRARPPRRPGRRCRRSPGARRVTMPWPWGRRRLRL